MDLLQVSSQRRQEEGETGQPALGDGSESSFSHVPTTSASAQHAAS